MSIIRLAPALALALSLGAGAASAKKADKKWKYAGEDHGIRFYFAAPKAGGPITLKLENTLSLPVEVSFRVMDTDWKKSFASRLAPGEADSSLAYRPGDGLGVRYPFIDRVFLESLGGPRDETASLSIP